MRSTTIASADGFSSSADVVVVVVVVAEVRVVDSDVVSVVDALSSFPSPGDADSSKAGFASSSSEESQQKGSASEGICSGAQ